MTRLLRRLTLVAALATCAAAVFAAQAQARPVTAGGPSLGKPARSMAYVQPLNENENGEAEIFGCAILYGGAVTGSPISDGDFLAIVELNCQGPGPCYEALGFLEMEDGFGLIEKQETGAICVVPPSGSNEFAFTFKGGYTIVGGSGRYAGAQGTGTFSKRFECPDPSSCTMTGNESSQQEQGPIKKGNDPAHVLLCSPTLVTRADGTVGNALQVPWADYQAWLADPTTHPEIPKGSIPAKYGQDVGLTCDNLPGYTDSGKKVDEQGTLPDDQTGPLEGAIYPYWVKA